MHIKWYYKVCEFWWSFNNKLGIQVITLGVYGSFLNSLEKYDKNLLKRSVEFYILSIVSKFPAR